MSTLLAELSTAISRATGTPFDARAGWWLWAGLIFLFGRMHVEPLDQITELGPVRRGLAVLMPVLWVLLFMPVPLQA